MDRHDARTVGILDDIPEDQYLNALLSDQHLKTRLDVSQTYDLRNGY